MFITDRRRRLWLAAAALWLLAPAAASPAAKHQLHYLAPADVTAAVLLPPPPAAGSVEERAELAQLHAIVAATPAERLARARWDQDHEDPGLFDAAIGMRLEDHPRTWALLIDVQQEESAVVAQAKKYFHRARPWGVDPTLPSCEAAPEHKPVNSYPSGHATLGYAVATILVGLLPDRAPDIMARAADYAFSREVCGVHFPSDIQASHALGSIIALKLLDNPHFQARYRAAKAELARPGNHLSMVSGS